MAERAQTQCVAFVVALLAIYVVCVEGSAIGQAHDKLKTVGKEGGANATVELSGTGDVKSAAPAVGGPLGKPQEGATAEPGIAEGCDHAGKDGVKCSLRKPDSNGGISDDGPEHGKN